MLKSLLRSRLATIGLAGVIAVGVLGTAGVALADDPGDSSTPPASTPTDSPDGACDGRHIRLIHVTVADIIKQSGLSKDVFKQGFQDGQSINQILQANGKDSAAIQAAVLADFKGKLDEAVANGKLTQEQADKLYARGEEFLPKLMEQTPKPHDGRKPGIPAAGKGLLQSAADAIGVDVKTLAQAIMDGQTVADVARSHNVDPQKVTDAIVASTTAHIDEAVKNGKLTQEQADKLKANLQERASNFVNNPHPGRPGGHIKGAPNSPAN